MNTKEITGLTPKDADDWYENAYTFLSVEAKEKYRRQMLSMSDARMVPEKSVPYENSRLFKYSMIWIAVFENTYKHCTAKELEKIRIRMTSVLRGRNPEADENILFHQAVIIRDELSSYLSAEWMERFVKSMDTFMKYGLMEECQYSRAGKILPPYLF
ncbi:hypothetical protein M2347_003158 [Chryseobacterium sp. H1D6B]|uniref:terpene synthase family protein n=1 Tax=Chryseobacterium sp. H1D6B TaxID=2940588 RepID=UPI0015CB348D|nr:hypothetical protein [Chryseobacterium sp. H1D6B]MDH6253431.1 hypothetical protein [Chryseobacterium sp. H1D6B]